MDEWQGCVTAVFGVLSEAEGNRQMLRARSDRKQRAVFFTRPERACLSEVEVAEASLVVVEVEASTVEAVTTTFEGAAAAAAISGAAAEEDLDEGADVEALINSKIKDLQNVSSVSRLQCVTSFAVGVESGSGSMLLASLVESLRKESM